LLEAFVFQQNLSSIDFGTLISSNQVSQTHFQIKSQKKSLRQSYFSRLNFQKSLEFILFL